MNFKRWPRPGAIKDRVSGLASQDVRANLCLAVFLFVERQTRPGFKLGLRWFLHLLVEAGDKNFAVGILQLAEDFDQSEDRVRCGSAINAGVQINLGAPHLDLGIEQPAQPYTERRYL